MFDSPCQATGWKTTRLKPIIWPEIVTLVKSIFSTVRTVDPYCLSDVLVVHHKNRGLALVLAGCNFLVNRYQWWEDASHRDVLCPLYLRDLRQHSQTGTRPLIIPHNNNNNTPKRTESLGRDPDSECAAVCLRWLGVKGRQQRWESRGKKKQRRWETLHFQKLNSVHLPASDDVKSAPQQIHTLPQVNQRVLLYTHPPPAPPLRYLSESIFSSSFHGELFLLPVDSFVAKRSNLEVVLL